MSCVTTALNKIIKGSLTRTRKRGKLQAWLNSITDCMKINLERRPGLPLSCLQEIPELFQDFPEFSMTPKTFSNRYQDSVVPNNV